MIDEPSEAASLVRRLRGGSRDALAALFECYRPRLRQMVRLRMDHRLSPGSMLRMYFRKPTSMLRGRLSTERGTLRTFDVVHGVDIGAFQTEDAVSFRLVAPSQVFAGVPFRVTVMALDQWGNTASTYTGTVHFSSTDLFAQLPDDSAFSGADGGAHAFTLALQTPGTQEIGVVDTRSASITGSVAVDVTEDSISSGSPGAVWAFLAWGTDPSGAHPRPA